MCYALLYTHNNRYSNFCLYCNLNLALNQNWVQNKSVHIKISFRYVDVLVLSTALHYFTNKRSKGNSTALTDMFVSVCCQCF